MNKLVFVAEIATVSIYRDGDKYIAGGRTFVSLSSAIAYLRYCQKYDLSPFARFWMNKISLILTGAILLAITLGAAAFGLWCNGANADFGKQLDKSPTIVAENNEPTIARKSGYALQGGKLVEVNIEQLALEAWNKDKLLPGKDLHYNYFEIGGRIADWKAYFQTKGLSIDKEFEDAYTAIAQRSEDHLKAQAFRDSQ